MYLKQSPLVDCLPAHPEERRRNPRREVQGVIFLKILKSDLRSEPIRACLIDLSAAGFRGPIPPKNSAPVKKLPSAMTQGKAWPGWFGLASLVKAWRAAS